MDEFYNMAWCEYLIKCYAWSRMEKEKWRHTRMIAYEARIGSHLDPKSLPRTIEQYMPIDGKKTASRVPRSEIEALKREREQILNKNKQ